jgi:membrane protease YdiL (CAAX protease family)
MNTGRPPSPQDDAPDGGAPQYQPPPSAYVGYVDLLHLRPPRVWPVFVAFVLFPVAAIGLSLLVFVLALIGPLRARRDVPPEEFRRMLEEANARPAVFLSQFLLMALLLAGISVVAAVLSPVPWRRRLRLVRPALPWHGWPVVLVGTVAVTYAIHAGLDLLGLQDAAAARRTAGQLRSLSGPSLVIGILLMGTAAAVVEELFFRGYAQTRLGALGRLAGHPVGRGTERRIAAQAPAGRRHVRHRRVARRGHGAGGLRVADAPDAVAAHDGRDVPRRDPANGGRHK